ncbi:MAG: metallo-mystery pair system four-Cys motif protein [Myxococcales bacterium]
MTTWAAVALTMVVTGCGDDGGGAGSQAVTVEFSAKVGTEDFVCGNTYDGLGADDSSLELTDFRFYVQDVELKNANGDYVPVELDANVWQTGAVTLLDFEDGCGETGNEQMNAEVTGVVPAGTYEGIRFKMGVPFTLNHENPATAPSPLNLTTMQWDWQGGHKFLRIDSGSFSPTDWRFHLGSTGCDGDPVAGGTTSCSSPNRAEAVLDGFDPDTNRVVADFAALVQGAALDENQADTPVGCMAGPADSDCGPLFENLGLSFAGSAPGTQSFFSAE